MFKWLPLIKHGLFDSTFYVFNILVLQKVNVDQSCSFVWHVKPNISQLPPLDMTFAMSYLCLTEEAPESRKLEYKFKLANFQVRNKNSVKHSGDKFY